MSCGDWGTELVSFEAADSYVILVHRCGRELRKSVPRDAMRLVKSAPPQQQQNLPPENRPPRGRLKDETVACTRSRMR